jgi:hypothetical protein
MASACCCCRRGVGKFRVPNQEAGGKRQEARAFTRLRRASYFLEAQKVTKNARAGRAPPRLLPNRRHRYASCSTMPAHGAHPWAPAQRGEAMPRLIRLAPALLGSRRPAPTRASMPSVASRPRSLCSLRLRCAAARLARSNSGAFPLRLPAMLGALYGAPLHSTAHPCATARLFRFIPLPQRNSVAEGLTGRARVRRFSRGPVVPWSRGPVVPWSRGPVVPWSRGPVVPWSRGPVVPVPASSGPRLLCYSPPGFAVPPLETAPE